MSPRALLLLAACAALAAPAPAQQRESLQDLLRRLRQQRDQILGALQGEVDGLVAQLETSALARDLPAMESTRAKLSQHGAAVAPLLVEKLDPGTSPTDAERLRAQYVGLVLADVRAPAVTARLVEILQKGSPEGRQNALSALATSPEPDRAVPAIVGAYRGGTPELRLAALSALAGFTNQQAQDALREALADPKPEVARAALDALALRRNTALADAVLRITASSGDAFRVLESLLGWYRAVPEAADAAHVTALVRLATDAAGPAKERARVLEALPAFADRFDNDARRELKSLTESPAREIREGAWIVLVLSGDKGARRDLLASYDDRIDKNKDFAAAWEERADVLYRIGEYKDAERDYRQSIKLSAQDLRARQDTAYVGLARCLARMGKLKDAAQTLERAPLTRNQIAALKTDPAFARLAEHSKYREVFEPR